MAQAPEGSSHATSMTLLAKVQAQEAEAWERFVELYAPLVHYWCRKAGLGEADTADVFQEVFQSVAAKIAAFRRDRPGDTLRGWLRTIAANKVRDHFRRSAGKASAQGGTSAQRLMHEVADPLVEDEAEEINVLQGSVRRALDWIRGDFEPQTWQAFLQTQVEERPPAEVAAELGMTAAAVRKAKYRVLRRLREELDGLLD